MPRPRLACSAFALLLIACSPATGGLGTFGSADDDSESGDPEGSSSDDASGSEAGTDDGESGGDGDPGDGDADPGDGDGDPGPMTECGDGIIEEGEDCEGQDLGGATCVDYGFMGGELGCTGGCMHDVTKCWNEACGNGVTDQGEDCDGPISDDTNCLQFQLGPGVVMCNQDCTYDLTDCGVEGEGEGCGFNDPCPDNQLHCVQNTCFDGSHGDDCYGDSNCLSGDCDKGFLEPVGTCV